MSQATAGAVAVLAFIGVPSFASLSSNILSTGIRALINRSWVAEALPLVALPSRRS
jgi:hypothetical protein